MSINPKNTSKTCHKVNAGIRISRNFVFLLIIIIITMSFIFFISSSTSKVQVFIPNKIVESEIKHFYKSGDNYYNNTFCGCNNVEEEWYVSSIKLYMSTYKPSQSIEELQKMVIYNTIEYDNNINNMVLDIYEENNEPFYNKFGIILDITKDCQSEYVLGYMKITLSSLNDGKEFNIDFYHFFIEEKNTSTKSGVILFIQINSLTYNNEYYNEWYNWKINNSTSTPSVYPYGIDVEISNYFFITNPLDSRDYYVIW